MPGRKLLIAIPVALAAVLVAWATEAAAQKQFFSVPRTQSFVQLQSSGSRIGVSAEDTQPDKPEGARVTGVEEGTPAAKAGVKEGDVIVEFGGERVRGRDQLTRLVRESPAGRGVKMTVLRDGKRIDLTVTPEQSPRAYEFEVPSPEFREGPRTPPTWPRVLPGPDRNFGWNIDPRIVPRPWRPGSVLGIGVQDLTPQLREYFGTKEGVLIASVSGGSAASRAGLKAGDVITGIDGRDVRSSADVRASLGGKQAGDQVKVTVVRDRKPQTIVVKIGE